MKLHHYQIKASQDARAALAAGRFLRMASVPINNNGEPVHALSVLYAVLAAPTRGVQ